MLSFGVIVVVLCSLSGRIWSANVVSHKTTDSDSGLSSWCTSTKNDRYYPDIPEECCNDYSCGKFIKGKATKYGLKNYSSWTTRLCTCDLAFYDCIIKNMDSHSAFKIYALFMRDRCFRKKPRHPNALSEDDEYEFVNVATMIGETGKSQENNKIPVIP